MILYKIFLRLLNIMTTWTICFLLLTVYNEDQNINIVQLVENQLLDPFPLLAGQRINYIRIIMLLGLNYICFWSSYRLMAEIPCTIKEIIRSHCKTLFHYQLSITKLILDAYYREFLYLATCVCSVLLVINPPTSALFDIIYLLSIWFLVDCISYFWISYFATDSLATIVLISMEIIFRYILIKMIVILFLGILFYCFLMYLLEVKDVRN
ncbi:hypothetical protein DIX61_05950 [Streptococcus iniae]|uniref:Membrane protein n=1 Tax=Streptococcus iniae TaxID=1346 RepID=A0A3L8GHP9_STRIN|nr:membrane protein [Streptococcus iniae SF1]AHY16170.1 membrane protein [Streptococcus iniae]ESR09848.1 hypothetical protein IUSA1_04820 [Streptococcus iniae IUSA1]AHY18034.1 membrane protein [Streptococcus iniae]AJG26324.1 membrane protein [Streptococcus iniae]